MSESKRLVTVFMAVGLVLAIGVGFVVWKMSAPSSPDDAAYQADAVEAPVSETADASASDRAAASRSAKHTPDPTPRPRTTGAPSDATRIADPLMPRTPWSTPLRAPPPPRRCTALPTSCPLRSPPTRMALCALPRPRASSPRSPRSPARRRRCPPPVHRRRRPKALRAPRWPPIPQRPPPHLARRQHRQHRQRRSGPTASLWRRRPPLRPRPQRRPRRPSRPSRPRQTSSPPRSSSRSLPAGRSPPPEIPSPGGSACGACSAKRFVHHSRAQRTDDEPGRRPLGPDVRGLARFSRLPAGTVPE